MHTTSHTRAAARPCPKIVESRTSTYQCVIVLCLSIVILTLFLSLYSLYYTLLPQSYLPPSFPNSQVVTSTPKPDDQAKVRRKPSPILPLPARAALSPPVALSSRHAHPPTHAQLPYLPPSTCTQSELGSVPLTHAASSSSIPGLGLGLRASPTSSRGKRRRKGEVCLCARRRALAVLSSRTQPVRRSR